MIGGVKTIDHNDVNPGLLMLDSFNNGYSCSDGGIKTEPADFGKTYITLDKAGWQGSTTTIIEERTLPVAVLEDFNNQHGYSSRPETPVTSTRGPGRRPGRRSAKVESEDEASNPEEAERLRVRRERNKEAAARCRKRKMDQIETLEKQVAEWEARNKDLQRKMQELKEEKDAVTFMLENHDCQKTFHNNQQHITTTQEYILPTMGNINTNTTSHQQILRVPQVPSAIVTQHAPTTIVTLAPSPMLTTSEKALARATNKVVVKAESTDDFAYPSAVHRTTEEILHNTEPQVPITLTTLDEEFQPIAKRSRRSRPESLSLQVKPQNYRSVVGVTIETPTNIFNTPTFDALMDGRTGLTPTNVLTPVCISMSALTTPVLSSPTCSIQQRNNAPNSNGKSFELMSL